MPRYLEELGLTAEQQPKAKEIFENHRTELEAVLTENFPRIQAVNEKMERELSAILTSEQQAKLKELKAKRPPRGPGGFGGPPPPHGFGPPPGPPPHGEPPPPPPAP